MFAGWPIPALLLFAAARVAILVASGVAVVRAVRLWRVWRRLPPGGTPGAGAPFAAAGRPLLPVAGRRPVLPRRRPRRAVHPLSPARGAVPA
jgi:hypothetical protein